MPEPTEKGPAPDDIVEFEGMKVPRSRVDEILLVRRQGQEIKDGIDLEHVHGYAQLVQQFEGALARAKRERDLHASLSSR